MQHHNEIRVIRPAVPTKIERVDEGFNVTYKISDGTEITVSLFDLLPFEIAEMDRYRKCLTQCLPLLDELLTLKSLALTKQE